MGTPLLQQISLMNNGVLNKIEETPETDLLSGLPTDSVLPERNLAKQRGTDQEWAGGPKERHVPWPSGIV
jgi:hypothetical protein